MGGGGGHFVGEHGRGRGHSLPRRSGRVLASSRMWVLVSFDVFRLPSGEMGPVGNSIESLKERAVALASMVAVWESTATLDFHSSRVCSGMGYWNIGTLGGCGVGGYCLRCEDGEGDLTHDPLVVQKS